MRYQTSVARTTWFTIFLRLLVIVGYVASYPLAFKLPVKWSWENQFIENAQAGVLLVGFLLALYFAFKAPKRSCSWFWLMIAPIWFILFARELSWGAVFLEPSSMDVLTGPIFSSSRLWYKSVVYPCVGGLALCCLCIFVLSKQYHTLARLWRWRGFPVLEMVLAVFGALLSTAAEGHGGLVLPGGLGHGQAQIVEELSELFVYIAIFAAQWRVYICFKRQSS